MSKPIPPREPIGDPFSGVVLALDAAQLLAAQPIMAEGIQIVRSGALIVRYGLRFLGKPHFSIVPGLVALDYGDMLVGEAAWEFVTRRSNLYPRAEVYGYRNDGRDDMIYVKNLDLALTPEALIYTDASATTPAARPTALIAPHDAALPPRLLECLPRFASLADWRANGNAS